MKKSIALFLTLIFLTIIIGIVGGIIGIYAKLSKNSFEKDLSQNSILIVNVKSILDNVIKDINSSDIKNIYNTFPISNKDNTFRVLIKVSPLMDKINLNEYKDKTKQKFINNFLDNILEFYQIKDPLFFKALILDTLDKDDKERFGNSEIKLKRPFFKNGEIYNFSHFRKILDYYAKYRDDKNIYNIPWKNLIYFDSESYIIDCNIINKKVAKFLGLTFRDKINCKELKRYEENKIILSKLSIIPFNRSVPYLVKIEIHYDKQNLILKYDINEKRIKNIKSYSLY